MYDQEAAGRTPLIGELRYDLIHIAARQGNVAPLIEIFLTFHAFRDQLPI